MARHDIEQLGQSLRTTDFACIASGEHAIAEIYQQVRAEYPDLCDDDHLCRENCASGHDQPEWQHETRRSLDSRKGAWPHSPRGLSALAL